MRSLSPTPRRIPDKLNYAAPGGGSQTQLAVEWLKILTGTKMTYVPYKGSAPAITDLVAGHVDLMFDNFGNSLQHIRAGRLRALAVADEQRLAEFPDLPAMAETYPGFVATSWFALLAPPKTPAAIVDRLWQAAAEALRMPDVEARLRGLGAAPGGGTAATAAFLGRRPSAGVRSSRRPTSSRNKTKICIRVKQGGNSVCTQGAIRT